MPLTEWPGRTVRLLLVVALAWLALSPKAQAGADCSITSVGLNFGVYDPLLTTPDDSTATVTVTCNFVPPGTTNVSYTVSLSSGLNGTSAASRRMAAGTARLAYGAFTDPARSQVWGNGTSGTVVASGSMTVGPGAGNGTRTATHVVYGRVAALQDVSPGAYADTLLLTLTY